jgi:uncharacterized protein with HEPN domain
MRNYRMFIEDILLSIGKIEVFTKGMDYKRFTQSDLVIDAVIRNLEIIGEAAKNVPESIKGKYEEIPWHRMVGLRNVAIHDYFGIDLEIVWEIITKNLPEVKGRIEEVLKGF